MERSGLSLVDGALALVTHPLNAPTPVLPLHATWSLCTLTLPRPPGPLPSLAPQNTKENPHACLLLASAPLIPPFCLYPSLRCSPLPHPKGTHYPSPAHSPRRCSSICLSSFQWPVTSFHFPCDCSWIIHAPDSTLVLLFFYALCYSYIVSSFMIFSDSVFICISILYSHYTLLIHLNETIRYSYSVNQSILVSYFVRFVLSFACPLMHAIKLSISDFRIPRMVFDNPQTAGVNLLHSAVRCMCKQ